MSDKLQKFTDLIQSIFELDKSDLNFGIYRIMNIRKAKIEKFLKEGLPAKVKETLAPFASNNDEIKARIAEIEKTCDAVGIEVAASKMADEYTSLKTQLISGVDMSALETDVYSALYSFFNRYYDEGDFISKRRYKEGVYAIPYEGEEVKLYWANQDQYYIKTAENFKDYTFKDDGLTVHFRLVDATTEQNNNKESSDNKRVFMLYEENEELPDIKTFEQNGNELIIRFVFDVPKDKKKKYADENAQTISNAIIKTYRDFIGLLRNVSLDPKKSKTVIEKHLEAYVAKNTFDYFIHKDLRGFLTRELDFYIKSEIIHLDDLDTANEKRVETYLAKVKAIKRVGKIIIDFLTQIENFQKKLWLKKKFVVETNWCITLDKIDEGFYQEIIENKDQIQEWIDMYAINEIESDSSIVGYSDPLTVDFLLQNKNLVIDTKHFTVDFKDRLIASIDNIDEQTDGMLIHGDNIQTIHLLGERYSEKIKCIHIDPPYNTDTSGFLYKNNYRHSSWMSMMNDRIIACVPFLNDEGSFLCHIDENEYENLWNLFQNKGLVNLGTVIWDKRNPMTGGGGLATQHEYITWHSRNNLTISMNTDNASKMLAKVEELAEKYGGITEDVRKEYVQWLNNNDELSGGEKAYRYIDDDGRLYQSVSLRAPEYRINEKFHCPLIHPITKKPCPVPPNGFSRTPETLEEMIKNGEIVFGTDESTQPRQKMFLTVDKQKQLTTVIQNAVKGTTDLKKMGLSFPYCHSVSFYSDLLSCVISKDGDIIFDFFAGSGTTGHTVLEISRLTNIKGKYILVEMGEYFNTVTKPRMQKAIYSADWKDGKPVNRNTGISHIMKYFRIEGYEDTLSNIELSDKAGQMYDLFGEDYLINYMLDIETEGSLLKLDCFKTPFEYKLKIIEKNETKEKVIDLIETFNYLVGLSVVRQSAVAYFNAVADERGTYEGAVRLIKHAAGRYAFKQVEGTLPEGRRVLVIWRNITDNLIESNAALDAYFTEHYINPLNRKFDVIYVNGDNNLENLRTDDENWKVRMTEIDFKKFMFEEV